MGGLPENPGNISNNRKRLIDLLTQMRLISPPLMAMVYGAAAKRTGSLLLRSPLPSLVLTKEEPTENYLIVEDTVTALGFTKTMVLFIDGCGLLPENQYGYKYALEGVFQIPSIEPLNESWIKAIPNSCCFLKALTIASENGSVNIDIVKKQSFCQKLLRV